jgi:hypothetical protein
MENKHTDIVLALVIRILDEMLGTAQARFVAVTTTIR